MKILTTVLLAGVVISLCLAAPVTGADQSAAYEQHISDMRQELNDVTTKLKSMPQEEWPDAAVETYLADSLWVVYYGILYYSAENNRLPDDVNSLAGTRFVPEWPNNPFNEWEPLTVSTSESFSAGNLALQICPPAFYSRINNPRPLSFELSIFGPFEEFSQNGNAETLDENTWAHVPNGALYQLGAFTETAAHAKAKWEKFQREHENDVEQPSSGGRK